MPLQQTSHSMHSIDTHSALSHPARSTSGYAEVSEANCGSDGGRAIVGTGRKGIALAFDWIIYLELRSLP